MVLAPLILCDAHNEVVSEWRLNKQDYGCQRNAFHIELGFCFGCT